MNSGHHLQRMHRQSHPCICEHDGFLLGAGEQVPIAGVVVIGLQRPFGRDLARQRLSGRRAGGGVALFGGSGYPHGLKGETASHEAATAEIGNGSGAILSCGGRGVSGAVFTGPWGHRYHCGPKYDVFKAGALFRSRALGPGLPDRFRAFAMMIASGSPVTGSPSMDTVPMKT